MLQHLVSLGLGLLLSSACMVEPDDAEFSGTDDTTATISVTRFSHWAARMEGQPLSAIQCKNVVEVEGTLMCLAAKDAALDERLVRATTFVEGNRVAAGTVIAHGSPEYTASSRLAGHDLKSSDLQRYWNAMLDKCRTDTAFCPPPLEQSFFTNVVLPRTRQAPFVLIAAAADLEPVAIFAHEILHAQFFQSAVYAATVERFWDNNVAAADQSGIADQLSGAYNVADRTLLLNEFQAYLLSNTGLSYYGMYEDGLRDALLAAGTPPLQVE